MAMRTCLVVLLAAGEGTRMKSAHPKVLHQVAGRSMVGHVIASSREAGADRLAVVVGPGMDALQAEVMALAPEATTAVQSDRLGTAHAVLAARAELDRTVDDVLVLYGDTPLVTPQTLSRVRARLAGGADVVVLGFETPIPTGYGRLLTDQDGCLLAIREEKDASDAERRITLCNSGIMGFRGATMLSLLDAIGNDNAKGEYYLTDAVEIATARGLTVVAETGDENEVLGVNDRAQLSRCEAIYQARARAAAMTAGVTLVAPETVFFSFDTALSRDVIVEPNVVFGPGVTVGEGSRIRAFSHLEGATVAAGAEIGPYARLRPGARVAAGARVGNFVEIKNARVDEGAKVNHLSYIGDAEIGARANIGAGTITCNYDGFGKFRTVIGADAFIGSNSALVAPVSVGSGAFVGSGSVVTDDVPTDALALGRGRQAVKPGWAAEFRTRRTAEKAAAKKRD